MINANTIDQAVESGALIDVSETAERVGMKYRTFITPALVAKHLNEPLNTLENCLRVTAFRYKFALGYDRYGPMVAGPRTYILEPHERYGHVVLILDEDSIKSLNLKRTTGEHLEYSM